MATLVESEIEAPVVVRGGCPHDCPDTCATLVTVESGRATRIQGDPDHPFTQGFLCAKVNRYLERTYHPERLLRPLRRVGHKGEGKFEPVSWDAALDDIAARLTAIARSPDGPASILPYSYAGTMGLVQSSSVDRRLFHALGASRLLRTICSTTGGEGLLMTNGTKVGADAEGMAESDLVILWGTNTLTSNPHLWPFVLQARANGAPVLCIDPIRTRTADQCDEWLPIRPGTDAALAMAMGHVVLKEFHVGGKSAYFRDYLKQYTDMPMLVRLREQDGTLVPDHFLRASHLDGSLGQSRHAEWKTLLIDDATGEVTAPNGSIGFRWTPGDDTAGRWNLELRDSQDGKTIDPRRGKTGDFSGTCRRPRPHLLAKGIGA